MPNLFIMATSRLFEKIELANSGRFNYTKKCLMKSYGCRQQLHEGDLSISSDESHAFYYCFILLFLEAVQNVTWTMKRQVILARHRFSPAAHCCRYC